MAETTTALERWEGVIATQRTAIERAAVQGWDTSRQLDILAQLMRGDLGACRPETVISSVIAIARKGLSLNPASGHAWLIPYRSKNQGTICTMQIGYKGLHHLLRKHAGIVKLVAHIVRPGEFFRPNYAEDRIEHYPLVDAAGNVVQPGSADKLIAAYAIAWFADGTSTCGRGPIWRSEIDEICRKSLERMDDEKRARSPWRTHFSAMARKTAIRALANAIDLPEPAIEAIQEDEPEEEPAPEVVVAKVITPEKAPEKPAEEPKKRPSKPAPKPAPEPPKQEAAPPKPSPQAPPEQPKTDPAPPKQADLADGWESEAAEYLK